MGEEAPSVVSDEFLCKGRRVSLYRRIVMYKGRRLEKDLVRFGRAVVIIPVLDDGRLVFVKQWRAAVSAWLLELPAGRVEPREDLKEAVQRELREETGYVAEELIQITNAYVSPGYSDEVQAIFIAKRLRYVGASPEAGEILRVVYMKPGEFLNSINADTVVDLKTLAAVLLYMRMYSAE
uniref:NUDIX hydrolase n=1 Tax=Ignisphaera aggregans TaxID=334771 RepID=A0A7C4FI42_9CREN